MRRRGTLALAEGLMVRALTLAVTLVLVFSEEWLPTLRVTLYSRIATSGLEIHAFGSWA